MISDKQFAANRANAQKSTGPKTDEGKATSSFNAVTHGATARSLVLPGEDETVVERLRAAVVAQFGPETPQGNELIDMLTQSAIRARRIPAFEKAILAWM